MASDALIAHLVQRVVAGDDGVVACTAGSVIHTKTVDALASLSYVPVSQKQQAAAPVRAKSPVTFVSVTAWY